MKKKIFKKVGVSFAIILIILAAAVLACLIFLLSFGKSPTKEQQAAYAKRTDTFYEGVFYTPEKFEVLVEADSNMVWAFCFAVTNAWNDITD